MPGRSNSQTRLNAVSIWLLVAAGLAALAVIVLALAVATIIKEMPSYGSDFKLPDHVHQNDKDDGK